MSETPSLSGRVAIVTGASSGIGRAIAERFGRAGAHVFLVGRTAAKMQASAERIQQAGGNADVVSIDVRDSGRLQQLVADVVGQTGRLDIMVNNAGLSYPAGILEGEPEQWREMLETNVLALLVGCQSAVRAMRECGAQGHIVNISSIAALRRDSGVYGATKHAVNAISATLRAELEDDDIRVVTIMPGAIATNFARHFDPAFVSSVLKGAGLEIEVAAGEHLPDAAFEKMNDALRPILGAAEDVAEAAHFAVTQPIHVNVSELVVRPPKQMSL